MHPLISERQSGIRASRCGCFYCLSIFDGVLINEWIDEGATALCPHCTVDSVISEYEKYTITEQELQRRHDAAFGK